MELQKFSLSERRVCNAFSRLTGKSEFKRFPSSGTIAAGSAAQFDENGEVAISATNKQNVGVNIVAATSATDATLDIIDDGSIWRCTTFTGTYAASYIGQQVDIDAGLTVQLGTTTNNDCTVVGGDAAGQAYVDIVFNQGGLRKTVVGVE
jgi:hypothetical protein